jgi:hypothetical protein
MPLTANIVSLRHVSTLSKSLVKPHLTRSGADRGRHDSRLEANAGARSPPHHRITSCCSLRRRIRSDGARRCVHGGALRHYGHRSLNRRQSSQTHSAMDITPKPDRALRIEVAIGRARHLHTHRVRRRRVELLHTVRINGPSRLDVRRGPNSVDLLRNPVEVSLVSFARGADRQ